MVSKSSYGRRKRLPHLAALLLAVVANAQTDSLLEGLQAFHNGDYQKAEESLRQSSDPRAKPSLAMTLAATSRCEAADRDLTAALDSTDKDVSRLAGLALVQCDIARNRTDEAAALIAKLRKAYPADGDVLYQAARFYMRSWNDTIYQLYQKNPSSFRVNQISGEILETQGRFSDAVAEYRKAIEKNPNALSLHFRLGRALLMSSHSPETLDAAMKEFEAELARNPHDAIAQYQVAQIFLVQQKPKDAAARLERALELNPDFAEALIALGKLRLDEKRNDDAIALLTHAVKAAPSSEAAHYSLMMAYRNAGNMTEARREKTELDKLQKAPEGEFTEFLKKLGEKPQEK
jgi:tetratricopeptide (TPR) repeat protein